MKIHHHRLHLGINTIHINVIDFLPFEDEPMSRIAIAIATSKLADMLTFM